MTVNWERHFTRFYQEIAPHRLADVPTICRDFTGLEESLWLSLAKRYNIDPYIELEPLIASRTASAKQRVIRMYAHYAPSKLADIDRVLEIMNKDGPGSVFALLVQKYGPEPDHDKITVKERVLIMYATYNRLDRMEKLDELMEMYVGMEETLIRRLVNELGPEPSASEAGDPREPRQRLRRIFTRYEPSLVNKVELVLARYEGKQITMFATMQRRYGREPSENEVRQYLQKQDFERERAQQEEQNMLKEAKGRDAAAAAKLKAKKEADAAAKIDLMSETQCYVVPERELPGDLTRPACIIKCRNHVIFNDALGQESLTTLTQDIFRSYDKLLVGSGASLVSGRFAQVNEANEWMAYMDLLYTNASPLTNIPKLRTIVSLLEMKFGTSLEEVWVAGGVESFLRGVDKQSEAEWAVYLTMAHGRVTEAELCTRNRLRSHYLHYNPGVPVGEVDQILNSFSGNANNLYEALCHHYGPEPPPLPVDLPRVGRILSRHAPEKMKIADIVIEAHTEVGDTAEKVIERICRTYGPEPNKFDEQLESELKGELEGRFFIFAAEMRMREVIIRRRGAALDVTSGGLMGAIQGVAAAAARIDDPNSNQQQHTIGFQERLHDIEQGERDGRKAILEDESIQCKDILDTFSSALDLWDQDANLELAEALQRQQIIDDGLAVYVPWNRQMKKEEEELMVWLGERLIWRAKWKHDEENLRRSKELHDIDGAARERRHRIVTDSALNAPSTSVQHQDGMSQLYAQLNAQATKVLHYNVGVQQLRRNKDLMRKEQAKNPHLIESSRSPHHKCAFHNNHAYSVQSPAPQQHLLDASNGVVLDSNGQPITITLDGQPIRTDEDWEHYFRAQCSEYIAALFKQHDRSRLRQVDQLLAKYSGKEDELVAALEQQYDVHHWRVQNTQERVRLYYKQMAPNKMEEVDVVLHKFSGREELLWQYLTSRYGPVPTLQTDEMRMYLKDRLVRYLASRAPHLLSNCDAIIAQCQGNGDNIFRKLAMEFGPEDRDVRKDTLARKLYTFYQRRGVFTALKWVKIIAERFIGREQLLSALLKAKFNDILDHYEPFVENQDQDDHAIDDMDSSLGSFANAATVAPTQ